LIFRYPGGKAKMLKHIMYLSSPCLEYREPFVGGGSVFWAQPTWTSRWINDVDESLIAVYQALRDQPEAFVAACRAIEPLEPGEDPARLKAVFDGFASHPNSALAWYFLNRTCFGGIPYRIHHKPSSSCLGKWSIMSDALERAAAILQGVTITAGDYLALLEAPGDDVWIYADPPFFLNNQLPPASRLYRHIFSIDQHIDFAEHARRCKHKLMISYDNHPEILKLYNGFNVFVPPTQHYRLHGRKESSELLILNY